MIFRCVALILVALVAGCGRREDHLMSAAGPLRGESIHVINAKGPLLFEYVGPMPCPFAGRVATRYMFSVSAGTRMVGGRGRAVGESRRGP